MAKSYERISENNANSSGKTDANLANDSLHLGGIPAEEYATEKWVQNYHDNKETALKKYIDEQDNSKLNEAKEYTNSMIRNQDFSGFAKDTDIQALDTKLTDKIKECHTNCETKINEVVKDVNNNFSDVTKGIEELTKNTRDLDNKYDELFQSVSDGKKKVAEAITDKGVSTSATATFDTMVKNIKNIKNEGLDTSDATATEKDIKLGKTAYVKGKKIHGINVEADISQITPSYGTDTSGATATAEDIVYGKTAYANGRLLVGTLRNNEVEEIYGLKDEDYTVNSLGGYVRKETTPTGNMAVSKNGFFIVNEVTVTEGDVTTRYIQSRKMGDKDIYIERTASSEGNEVVTKKYLFSFEELGLNPNTGIDYISFGNTGFNGSQSESALCISQGSDIHFYRYVTTSVADGYIGYDYKTDDITHWVAHIDGRHCTCAVTCANKNPNVFGVFAKSGQSGYFYLFSIYEHSPTVDIDISKVIGIPFSYGETLGIKNCKFSTNDNYIYGSSEHHSMDSIISYNEALSAICKISATDGGSYYINSASPIQTTTAACAILPNETQVMMEGYMYSLFYDTDKNKITTTKISETQYSTYACRYAGFSPDGKYYYEAFRKTSSTILDKSLYIFEVDFNSETEWKPIQTVSLPLMAHGDTFAMSYDMNFAYSGDENQVLSIKKDYDQTNIIGIKYRDKYFYNNVQNQGLTAGQPDVRKGKTFIGWMGYPEIGTMEVQE